MVTVYGLECVLGTYVGCTAGKIGKRMREHRCLLNAGKHMATGLQMAWNLDSASFQMKVLEVLPEDCPTIEKRERELSWMKHYRALGQLLNDHDISYQPPNGAQAKAARQRVLNGNRNITPESNEKRRLAQLGKPKGHGAKISATKQAKKLLMR